MARKSAAQTGAQPHAVIAAPLWIGLMALALCRASLTFVPRMDLWSLNLQRFLPLPGAWGLWLAALLLPLLIPARRAAGLAGIVRVTASGRVGPLLWAGLAVALVLALPDRVQMTGDFILRQRAIEEGGLPSLLFPQALPLDVWLHYTLPRLCYLRLAVPSDAYAHAWGALLAALLAGSAVAFARSLQLRPEATFAATGLIVFSGALGLFTGYDKGLADLVVPVVALCASSIRMVTRGTGHAVFVLSLVAAIALHRMGLLFVPAALAVWILQSRRHGLSRQAVLGMGVTVGALVLCGPRALQTIASTDLHTHLSRDLSLAHGLNASNALVLVAPLLPLVPWIMLSFGRRMPARAELLPILFLAATLVGAAALVAPQQGIVRDWDVYAPAGMALAVVTAWLAAESISRIAASPQRASRHLRNDSAPGLPLAIAAVLAAAAPSAQWLLHLHDVQMGMRRISAAIAEPPERSPLEKARMWDYLGVRQAWLGDWQAAAAAFAHSAELLPTPRVLDQWAKAEIQSGRWESAREAASRLTRSTPNDPNAWRTLAATTTHLNDRPRSREAAEHILLLSPDDRDARDIIAYLDSTGQPMARRPHGVRGDAR